jgi:hypothetical protein
MLQINAKLDLYSKNNVGDANEAIKVNLVEKKSILRKLDL